MNTWNTIKTARANVRVDRDLCEMVDGRWDLFPRPSLAEVELCFVVTPQDAFDIVNAVDKGRVALVRALTPTALSRLENLGSAIEGVEGEIQELTKKCRDHLTMIEAARAECLTVLEDSGDWDSSGAELASEILRLLGGHK